LSNNSQSKISRFGDESVNEISLPERFTFPFDYAPHPLTKIAAAELQHYLETQTHLDHNFGLNADREGVVDGKMFGVLVVQDTAGKLGYLSAFSGKLAGSNDHPRFVPPVFDMLDENSFFSKEIISIDAISARIREIEKDNNYQHLKLEIERLSTQSIQEISVFRDQLRGNKASRKLVRDQQKNALSQQDYEVVEAELIRHSLHDKHQLKVLINRWEQILEEARTGLAPFEFDIDILKNERQEKSTVLQQKLFEQYVFLNKDGKSKSLQEIFSMTPVGKPPTAAGECATPKLLQFAFANGYKPLAMAEFWWGASPKSEIRKHKHYYPACTARCKPILAHMLEGILVDESPFLRTPEESSELEK
jgi:tRNA pseudouridine32 synthase/23S rRNA pseudouridine746 synthase